MMVIIFRYFSVFFVLGGRGAVFLSLLWLNLWELFSGRSGYCKDGDCEVEEICRLAEAWGGF